MRILVNNENINPNLTPIIKTQFDSFMNQTVLIEVDNIKIYLSEVDIERINKICK